jgi:hypothetical protein
MLKFSDPAHVAVPAKNNKQKVFIMFPPKLMHCGALVSLVKRKIAVLFAQGRQLFHPAPCVSVGVLRFPIQTPSLRMGLNCRQIIRRG